VTCFFYFDFTSSHQQTTDQLLRALLEQLSAQSPAAFHYIKALFDQCRDGASQSSLESLLACFRTVLPIHDNVFVVTDALDECTAINDLMKFIESAIEWKLPQLHLLVTRRKILEIDKVLDTSVQTRICLKTSDVDPDIKLYVSRALREDKAFKRWSLKTLQKIEDELTGSASGMYAINLSPATCRVKSANILIFRFRWVDCQLESLKACRRLPHLEKALQNLPSSLDETYKRILDQTPKRSRSSILFPLGMILTSISRSCFSTLLIVAAISAIHLSKSCALDL
jgi:hypothetical protein